MLAFKYISLHYIKYFFIILIALIFFLVGFDSMGNLDQLDISANLLLIYLVYKSFYAIDLLVPLALVFAMITTKMLLIRSNSLVSFYSLGYTKVDILKPFVIVSTVIILLFISIHSFSEFARANEFANNIRKNAQYLSPTRDLFFTYKDKFIYFARMLPIQAKAENVRVFTIKNNSLKEVLVAKKAIYKENSWHIDTADILIKPDDIGFESKGMRVKETKEIRILHGFKPKMIDQVYEGKVNFTIPNAIDAFILLTKQHSNTDVIKSALYKIFIYPFFVPSLVVIIFFFVPISARFLNTSLFSFGAVVSSLIIWSLLFTLGELSNHKTISSELGIILPVILLFLIAIWQWRKYAKTT
jgi:lipopolysaccharide export system permease protein